MTGANFLRCSLMVVFGGFLILGCGPESPPSDPRIIAVYRGGEVTRDDLDRVVLTRAPEDRNPGSEDPEGWYRMIIEDIVLERLLLADPDIDQALIESRMEPLRLEEQHRLGAELYLDRHLPEVEPVTEADAREEYEAHPERWVQRGRREVWNIFLRNDGRNRDAGVASAAAEIARRFERGESFGALAREYSDSESRHQGGVIGWLEADRLDPALAGIVFAQEEGRLSEPVTTPQGVHLFLVNGVLEERKIPFGEARGPIEERLTARRTESLMNHLAAGLPEVRGAFVVEGQELASLLHTGEPDTDVVRIGDFGLTLRQLLVMMNNTVTDGETSSLALAERLVEVLVRRETVFSAAQAEGLDHAPEVEAGVEEALARARLAQRRRMVVERTLDSDPAILSQWFEVNQARFMTPVRLEVSRLVVALDGATVEPAVAALEALSGKEVSVEALDASAERLGGRVEHDGWKTLSEVAAIRPMAARLASTLEIGRVSPPYRTRSTLEVLRIGNRQEPELQSLADVYDRARAEYLAANAVALYGRWARTALAEADLLVFFEKLVDVPPRLSGVG